MTALIETRTPAPRSRWETIVWPRWLPVRARLPLIAQIAGAIALVAALAMPRLPDVAAVPAAAPAPATRLPDVAAPAVPAPAARPAHLNLDVRHSLRSVDLSIAVDGRRVLGTTLAGSGKRFGVFGKRAEKGFTQSLRLSPGVRVVQVRVRSEADKFDQTRVERFDLDSASVAAMRITADKSGLFIVAERPPAPERPPPAPPAPPAHVQVAQVAQVAQAQQAGALAELYITLRSILIAVAGFIGSAATGFVVQEFMRSRKEILIR